MKILCTNDDGYLAEGLRVLAEAARTIGEVSIVAPDREQSATSHSLTLHDPLRSRRAPDGAYVVDGTPTDCVMLAVAELIGFHPDLCLSGVNHGPNMGEDVLYSGTVAAAMEATVMGIPSVAVSYAGERTTDEVGGWIPVLGRLLKLLAGPHAFPENTLLSVNLPSIDPNDVKGVKVTTLGTRRYSNSITRALDPAGREFFWIGGGVSTWSGSEESDFKAVADGYISVTPLHLDLTNYGLLEEIRGWNLNL